MEAFGTAVIWLLAGIPLLVVAAVVGGWFEGLRRPRSRRRGSSSGDGYVAGSDGSTSSNSDTDSGHSGFDGGSSGGGDGGGGGGGDGGGGGGD
jgi:hypothetical protein